MCITNLKRYLVIDIYSRNSRDSRNSITALDKLLDNSLSIFD